MKFVGVGGGVLGTVPSRSQILVRGLSVWSRLNLSLVLVVCGDSTDEVSMVRQSVVAETVRPGRRVYRRRVTYPGKEVA